MKESVSDNITMLIEDTGRYIEAKTELWKLKAVDKSAEAASSLVSQLIVCITVFIGIVALNTGIALLLGKWLGEAYYGFFIVAGFYFLLGLVIYLSRNSLIKTPLYNAVINKIFK